ncbi:hypothetical protein K3495_g3828 [Podosphaera aphanis]|nr:hypothetical protein K3495_g3828 [Podosphaera aphanis]
MTDSVPSIPQKDGAVKQTKKKRYQKKKPNEKTKDDENSSNGTIALSGDSVPDKDPVGKSQPSVVNSEERPYNQETINSGPVQINGNKEKVDDVNNSRDDSTPSSRINTPGFSISDGYDSSSRLKALSLEREALLVEVEQLRKSLEDVQDKHISDLNTINNQHATEILNIQQKYDDEILALHQKHTEEIATITTELDESNVAKQTAETQYQHLLERVNTIKSSLGERFKADKQELAEAKEHIESLTSENEAYEEKVKHLMKDIERLDSELQNSLVELSNLRNRHNLSQQNWSQERNDLVVQKGQLREEVEAAKEAMGDWELLAMEERSMREGLAERIKDLEEQISSQKEALDSAVSENENKSHALDSLRRALQDVQDTRKQELRELVESYENQLQAFKRLVQDSDARATEANSTKSVLQAELDRLAPFEKEIKEKNLLIGKLRHEAIVLNEHLTKALRFLKKSKPEDNIDRQIVTNHFLHFLALDRSDPKKFQILQLIASLLNWTEEQKEQAGLARPGTSNTSIRLGNSAFHSKSSTTSLATDFFNDSPSRKESLTELWNGFLERSAEEGSSHSRNGSLTSVTAPKSEI